MNEQNVRKRSWVLTAAVVFLAVMLVLTFFSNTIMNRSLPEVAAQYTTSGTITARIRGTGTVTANESFEVITNQTRTVNEVRVRLGDEVSVGDVLITMTGSESEELDMAQNKLRELEIRLEKELINSPLSGSSVADAARAVQSARNDLTTAQRVLSGISYSETAYNAARSANNRAQSALTSAMSAASARQYELSIAHAEFDVLDPPPMEEDDDGTYDFNAYTRAEQKVRDATFANSVAQATLAVASDSASAAEREFSIHDGNRNARDQANAAVRMAQQGLEAANTNLALAQTSDDATAALNSIEMRELNREIDEAKETIAELEKEGSGSEITAIVSGVIKEINISPGNQTEMGMPLMVIEVVDRGYSLSFTVTSEQAARVRVGDNAEVDRGWWGGWSDEIRAALIGIRNDPQNPATSRILQFAISGDVESGSQLNINLSERSENFSIIVPNSAIRTDTNGDFVLVVISRSSPLGNRYIATRADVNVMASDDTNTAVSGALTTWDFVITRASAPIEPGMQVRLADNP